jgi:cell division protein FtsZ
MMQAERGMQELLESVDTLIVIPNEKLLAVAKDAGFFESFRIADDVLRQGVQGISDIITITGIINRDFADVKTTMAGMGYAVMGTASRGGSNRAVDAAMAAMASPLLEAGAIDGARGILINITGSSNLKLSEVNEASTLIQNAAHEDCNIIFGAVMDERMGDDVKITVIATGFKQDMPARRERMLAESTMPAETSGFSRGTYEVPIRPRVGARAGSGVGAALVSARFASEGPRAEVEERDAARLFGEPAAVGTEATAKVDEGKFTAASATHSLYAALDELEEAAANDEIVPAPRPVFGIAEPVAPPAAFAERALVPVPASVFDDDFFRATYVRKPRAEREEVSSVAVAVENDAARDDFFAPDTSQEYAQPANALPSGPMFAGAAAGSHFGGTSAEETDELDIPAFLRRSR